MKAFFAFQYPVEIPGVSNIYLLKAALNAIRKHKGLSEVDAMDFLKLVKEKIKAVNLDEQFLYRGVNEGFSGGEKKRNEILQMAVLEPRLCILDETDSGLDIDLRLVAEGVNPASPNRSFILVTHYQPAQLHQAGLCSCACARPNRRRATPGLALN